VQVRSVDVHPILSVDGLGDLLFRRLPLCPMDVRAVHIRPSNLRNLSHLPCTVLENQDTVQLKSLGGWRTCGLDWMRRVLKKLVRRHSVAINSTQ
jgi:hypothetical protein